MAVADPPAVSPLAGTTPPWLRAALFAGWLALVGWMAAHHVFWRDEVRALTLALSGEGLAGMARAVQGEGHPLVWYLALRLAHMAVPVREVLPATGLAFGIAAAALFAARAPFGPVVLAAGLFSGWMAQEYAVMARNYGVAALLMFILAERMARGDRGGWRIGLLLALLANTSVPAVVAAGGFLLFWLVELVAEGGGRPGGTWRSWGIAAALLLAGVAVCFVTVYPPVNDAAVTPLAAGWGGIGGALVAAASLAAPLSGLMPQWSWALPGAAIVLALLLAASPFSLARSPAGLAAALAALPAFALFFQFVYPGGYRHHALYLVFLLALHWMVAGGRGGRWSASAAPRRALASGAGGGLALLLVLQVFSLTPAVADTAQGHVASRARDLADLLRRRGLTRAVVLSDPDADIEPLPYYAANPTWLVRERRFGRVSHFTSRMIVDLTLADVLTSARAVRRATGRPVVILSAPRLDPAAPAAIWREGYRGTFASSPAQVRAFLAATTRLARFAPATSDESYDVYLLNG